jgi:hypothetical protein
MENNTKVNTKALNVMKKLTSFVKEEMKELSPLRVTYIANTKAKIVRTRRMSEVSTDDE